MQTHVGTPVNLQTSVVYTFSTALNDSNVQKQWKNRPPQETIYEVSVSVDELFSPAEENFHLSLVSPLTSPSCPFFQLLICSVHNQSSNNSYFSTVGAVSSGVCLIHTAHSHTAFIFP